MAGQAGSFNPRAAGDLLADIQFRATGDFVLRVKDGHGKAYEGTVPAPSLPIHTPSEVGLQITRGELSGQTAYMKGLYSIEGDMGLLLRMKELFSPHDGILQRKPGGDASPSGEGPVGRCPFPVWPG